MNSETRNCGSCKTEFIIAAEDFAYYAEIKVPPPTWCPECRLVRRLSFFNERTIYKKNCDLCKKSFMSAFPEGSPYTVYCAECWHSDNWDPMDYGKDVDFSRPFLEQVKELFLAVPQIGRNVTNVPENSEYCNCGTDLKNCYLVFNSDRNEDCMYSTYLENSKRCLDLCMAMNCEKVYGGSNLFKNNNVRFSSMINECMNISFSKNLVGCSDCFGCVNLRKKSYHFFNQPMSKEEYQNKIAEYDTGSWKTTQELREKMRNLELSLPKRYAEGLHNSNVSGDYIFYSKNVFDSHEVGWGEDSKWCSYLFLEGTRDSYDYTMWGGGADRMYEVMGGGGGARDVRFSANTWYPQTNIEYSKDIIMGSDNLFGCIALVKKKYCILNKQYSKEEYEALQERIIEHMKTMPYVDQKGRIYKYGEFFPSELSPFGYNETLAQVHRPISREEAKKKGFQWYDAPKSSHTPTIASAALPDNIRDVGNEIIKEIIACAHEGKCDHQCPGVYRITSAELEFYRDMVIPLPRLCSNCRHYERFEEGKRIVSAFYRRKCECGGKKSRNGVYQNSVSHTHGEEECPNEFETPFAPERPEIVYCEACYQAEVI